MNMTRLRGRMKAERDRCVALSESDSVVKAFKDMRAGVRKLKKLYANKWKQ